MCAALCDTAVFHIHNAVGILDGGQPVGDYERSTAFEKFVKTFLQHALSFGIDA